LSDRREKLPCVILLLWTLVCTPFVIGQASDASMEDVIQAIHSFQQLAAVDPAAAGNVWMEERTASTWRRTVEQAVEDLFDATILFGHLVPLAAADETGVRAGLYNPWVGMLLLLTFDPLATAVESYSIRSAAQLGDEAGDPLAFATEAMSAIDTVVTAFDAFKSGALPGRELSARDLDRRVEEVAESLLASLGDARTAEDGSSLLDAIALLFAGELEEPLTLLEAKSTDWVDSLLPLWVRAGATSTVVVLASMESPLDWAWLQVGDDAERPIESVSVIRLYDRIVTRGGDAS